MNRIIISLSFLFLSFASTAQFDYSFDIVGSIDYTNINEPFSTSFYAVDSKINFRFGGNFNVKIKEKSFLKTGIRYVEVGYKEDIDDLRWPSEIGPNGYEPDPTLPKYFDNVIDQKFIEIPILFRYDFVDKKFGLYVEAGVSPHIHLSTRNKSTSNLGTFTSNIDGQDKRFNMSYIIGFGTNYTLSNTLQLFVQPTFRLYPANTAPLNLGLTRRSFGVEFGIRRGFMFEPKNKD